jgi:hypothetical protein
MTRGYWIGFVVGWTSAMVGMVIALYGITHWGW